MRVGIITFHRALNYGALLQAYALQKVLEELNIKSEIIDYRNPIIEDIYRLKRLNERNGLKNKVKYILQRSYEIEKREKFEYFRQNKLLITNKTYFNDNDLSEISDSFDYYITGSDQVWNYDAHGFDKNYFLNFVSNPNKRISYAASFGVSSIPDKFINDYSILLSNISNLLVREQEGKDIIKKICGLNSHVVLDPTLLLTKEQWTDEIKEHRSKGKYILLYCFELTDTIKKFVENLSKETGLEVRSLVYYVRNPLKVKCVNISNSDPLDFVRYFADAEYVVTNSFHGTAFAINLNKNFFVDLLVRSSNVNSRLENIIRLTNLESRYIKDNKSIKELLNDRIDWQKINCLLNEKRKESINLLNEALKR